MCEADKYCFSVDTLLTDACVDFSFEFYVRIDCAQFSSARVAYNMSELVTGTKQSTKLQKLSSFVYVHCRVEE